MHVAYSIFAPFKESEMADAAFIIAGLLLLVTGGNFLLKGSVDISLRMSTQDRCRDDRGFLCNLRP
jgi:hypothetical protein